MLLSDLWILFTWLFPSKIFFLYYKQHNLRWGTENKNMSYFFAIFLYIYTPYVMRESKNHCCGLQGCIYYNSVKSRASYFFVWTTIIQYKPYTKKSVFDFYQVPILPIISVCFRQAFVLNVDIFLRDLKYFLCCSRRYDNYY